MWLLFNSLQDGISKRFTASKLIQFTLCVCVCIKSKAPCSSQLQVIIIPIIMKTFDAKLSTETHPQNSAAHHQLYTHTHTVSI